MSKHRGNQKEKVKDDHHDEIYTTNSFEDELDEDDEEMTESGNTGYCHYNTSGDNLFSVELLGVTFQLEQKPTSKDLGIGSVVWDSSVIFAKYVEENRNSKFAVNKMQNKTVLELGTQIDVICS